MKTLSLLIAFAAAAVAQNTAVPASRTYTPGTTVAIQGTLDRSAATADLPAQGTSLPATCTVGSSFVLTSGANWPVYDCRTLNTWTQRGTGVAFGYSFSSATPGTTYYLTVPMACTLWSWNLASAVTSQTITISIASPSQITWPGIAPGNTQPVALATTGALPTGLAVATMYYPLAIASTVTITIASPGVVTWTGSNLAANTQVSFATTGALPTGISNGATYFVVNPTADTFQLSLTSGGAAINTTGSQSGVQTATLRQITNISATNGGSAINTSGGQSGTQTAFNAGVIDVWKVAAGSTLPTVSNSIVGTGKPTLIAGSASRSTDLSGWSATSVAAGDILGFNVVSTPGPISIVLGCR